MRERKKGRGGEREGGLAGRTSRPQGPGQPAERERVETKRSKAKLRDKERRARGDWGKCGPQSWRNHRGSKASAGWEEVGGRDSVGTGRDSAGGGGGGLAGARALRGARLPGETADTLRRCYSGVGDDDKYDNLYKI